MNSEKTIYTTNLWQEVVLAECCEEFGVSLKLSSSKDSKNFWSLSGHVVNLDGALTGYFNNLKLGRPERVTDEELEKEKERLFPEQKDKLILKKKHKHTLKL